MIKLDKKYFILALILIIGVILSQNHPQSIEINMVGSTSVQPICEQLAQAYMETHPNITINIQGGGSNFGIKSLSNEIAEIGMCSMELENNYNLTTYELGNEGIVIAVNPANNVTNLTDYQLQQIYSGNITNWQEVGGVNKTITVLTREEGSGTLNAFKKLIMNGSDITQNAIVLNSQGSLKQAIGQNPDAIGFVPYSYLDNSINAVAINGIYPTMDSIANGSYILQRPYLLLTNSEINNQTQDFLNWLNSSEATFIINQNRIVRSF